LETVQEESAYFCVMKYQEGDDIIVLHTKEEGNVVEIISDQMVLIEVRGIRFPAYMDQIDFPYFDRFTKKNVYQPKPTCVYIDEVPPEKKTKLIQHDDAGVWLYFLPMVEWDEFNDEIITGFKVYLQNKNTRAYRFNYQLISEDTCTFELQSDITASHDFYLHDISFESFSDNPNFIFDFHSMKPDGTLASSHTVSKKIRSKQVFKMAEDMKQKNEPSIRLELFNEWPVFVPAKKDYPVKTGSVKNNSVARPVLQPRTVVDLHIEKITDRTKGLDNYTILQMQIQEFEKWFDVALCHRLQKMIVIHGIGTGRLKEELHEVLKTKQMVSSFINQYHPSYGYGATEIFFSY
jgi:hypothetical protein